jgi:nicotinate dehydrogenase subunit B
MRARARKEVAGRAACRPDVLSRRSFLKFMGGVTILFAAGDPVALAQESGRWPRYPEDFNAYLRIGEDGRISCFTGKIEMGQGIVTSLAQMAAEELDVPLSAVDMVMGDTSLCPEDVGTFGSLTTRTFGPALRRAAAEARAVLIELAAERLDLPPERLAVKDGMVVDTRNPDVSVSYAELTGGRRIVRRLERSVSPKEHSEHTVCGVAADRTDAVAKVSGEAKYVGDIRLPGMLYAKILRPPAHGATLKSADVSGAEAVDGARVIRDGDLIAVLHKYPDVAEMALGKISADYDVPEPAVDNANVFDHLMSAAAPSEVVAEEGDIERGEAQAVKAIDSVYLNNYVAHAAIETHTALAQVQGDAATVWISTQTPFRARDAIADALGLAKEKVRVITPFVGGGFGGKSWNQQAFEAVRLAKLAGVPVQVAWTRAEEFFNDTFRPAALVKVRSGIDGEGRLVLWDYQVLHAGERSSQPIYAIPNYRVLSVGSWMGGPEVHPFRVGAWRGPGSNTNVFAMESQMDVMAQAAGLNPLDFRLKNLSDKRMAKVLTAAAETFGGSFAVAPSGRGYGVACTDYHDTYVAAIAEVSVDKSTGAIRAKRVVCAQDMGEIINPEGARLQIEGCVTMGLGYALTEEIHFKGGTILDKNFDTYELPRFSWLPSIECVLIDNPEMPPKGCGEPPITAMGAVMANAVYDAIGARLFELPMTPARVKRALQKG